MNLTKRQHDVLMYILSCDRAPTYQQIAEAMDMKSKSCAWYAVGRLADRGFLTTISARACGIEVTEKGKRYGRKHAK